MKAFEIIEVKKFMNLLLTGETFDHFLLSEAVIRMGVTYRIDGHVNQQFYDLDEYEQLPEDERIMLKWKSIKPMCFNMIKGKYTPLSFQFIMELSATNQEKLLQQTGVPFSKQDIAALVLNIRYEASCLTCVTGTALHMFTLDKSLEQAWDDMIGKFLIKNDIVYEIQ